MPRRTKEEMMKTRRKILMSALDLFYEKGFSRTSLGEIAKRAGYTRGAIYWHFKDKIDLIVALAEEIEIAGDESTKFIISEIPSSLNEIKDMAIRYIEFLNTDSAYRKFYEIIYYHTEWTDDLIALRNFYKERVRSFVEWTAKSLSKLQENGVVRAELDCNSAAVGLNALIEGLISANLNEVSGVTNSCKTDEIVDIYLRGIKR